MNKNIIIIISIPFSFSFISGKINMHAFFLSLFRMCAEVDAIWFEPAVRSAIHLPSGSPI